MAKQQRTAVCVGGLHDVSQLAYLGDSRLV